MKTSKSGIDLIKGYEKFSATVYKDAAGKPTIGYGHLIKSGENFTRITKARALEILSEDLIEAESAVKRRVKIALTQRQFDAIVSFVFNTGAGAFAQSTLLKRINASDHPRVPMEMTRWVFSGGNALLGLARRRVDEAALYVTDKPLSLQE